MMTLNEDHEKAVQQMYTLARLNEQAKNIGHPRLHLLTFASMLSTYFGIDNHYNIELHSEFVTVEYNHLGFFSQNAVVTRIGKYTCGYSINALAPDAIVFLMKNANLVRTTPTFTPPCLKDSDITKEQIWKEYKDIFFTHWIEDHAQMWLGFDNVG